MQTSVIILGREKLFARPANDINRQQSKGGEPSQIMTSPIKKSIPSKEEMKTSNSRNLPDPQPVDQLIRTAEWVRTRGQIRPISDDPAIEEQIGILFNVIRRQKNISLERLANTTGYKIEELTAFEAGLLKRLRMCEMLPVLAEIIGVPSGTWLQAIKTGKIRLQPQ